MEISFQYKRGGESGVAVVGISGRMETERGAELPRSTASQLAAGLYRTLGGPGASDAGDAQIGGVSVLFNGRKHEMDGNGWRCGEDYIDPAAAETMLGMAIKDAGKAVKKYSALEPVASV